MAEVGRPTKYTPELIQSAKMYLINYPTNGEVIPTIEGLSGILDISRETIYEWTKDPAKQEFSDIVRRIMAEQAKTLISNGLQGKFAQPTTKLLLSKHGYRESSEVEHSGGLTVNVIRFKDDHSSA